MIWESVSTVKPVWFFYIPTAVVVSRLSGVSIQFLFILLFLFWLPFLSYRGSPPTMHLRSRRAQQSQETSWHPDKHSVARFAFTCVLLHSWRSAHDLLHDCIMMHCRLIPPCWLAECQAHDVTSCCMQIWWRDAGRVRVRSELVDFELWFDWVWRHQTQIRVR